MAVRSGAATRAADPLADAWRMDGLIQRYCLEVMEGLAESRVEETVRQWLGRVSHDRDDFLSGAPVADAMALAMQLSIFAPSLMGSTPIDRLVRQRQSAASPEDRAAMQALARGGFRLLRLLSRQTAELFLAEDAVNGEKLSLLDDDTPAAAAGVTLAAYICRLPDGIYVTVGPVVALDPGALAVAMGFARPGQGLKSPYRCAAAIYRHIVRHGSLLIGGAAAFFGDSPANANAGRDAAEAESPIGLLARKWAAMESGLEPSLASANEARSLTSFPHLIEALSSCVRSRRRGETRLAEAYSRLAFIQMETFQRRAIAGTGADAAPLDVISDAMQRAIAEQRLSPDVRTLFDDLRRRLAASNGGAARKGAGPHAEELARVLQRIRALRAKTVDQGCTEQEALASANKVAQLLDRYGLSLSEIEIREQACEGVGIDTGRRRRIALDECVTSIAMFCDCKAWSETTPEGAIRYVFFGLPADVEAAHYLYDLIGVTFDTESARFKTTAVHAGAETGDRRRLVNSFQSGLSLGICDKLTMMKRERDKANLRSSGRDLVPIKTSVIEDELDKLGLSFHRQEQRRKKRVVLEAFEAGRQAGHRFEMRRGLDVAC